MFGAVITYHINKDYKSAKELRQEKEKTLDKSNQNVPFPGWDALSDEKAGDETELMVVIKNDQGGIVRKMPAPMKKGMHRIAWDLRYPMNRTITPGQKPRPVSSWMRRWMQGPLAAPGTYTATLVEVREGQAVILGESQSFEVVPLRKGTLSTGATPEEFTAYSKRVRKLQNDLAALNHSVGHGMDVLEAIDQAHKRSQLDPGQMLSKINETKAALRMLNEKLNGNAAKGEIGERSNPTVNSRLSVAARGLSTTYGPTEVHSNSLSIAEKEFPEIKSKVDMIIENTIPALIEMLEEAGAPYIKGY
jgi:hypothetical protein